jgi:GNAT superfamily N-acetyltransferase
MNPANHLPSPPESSDQRSRPWVPVRSLGERHRARVLAHLIELPAADRYLRFGHAASDAQIASYTDRIDFDRDEVFGIYSRRLHLLAVAHLAMHADHPVRAGSEAEFGVSVLPQARRRGYATRLFEHCMLHAATRGVDTLMVHALSENATMLHIARRAGATIDREGGDAQAVLRLPEPTWRDTLAARLEDGAGELDYLLKLHSHRLSSALHLVEEIREEVASEVRTAGDLDGHGGSGGAGSPATRRLYTD